MKVQPKLTFKNQYSLFHEVEKIDESNWRTVNANFQFSFCEIEKKTEVSLRLTFKISILNLRIICLNLSSTVENKGNLHIIKLVTFQTLYNE